MVCPMIVWLPEKIVVEGDVEDASSARAFPVKMLEEADAMRKKAARLAARHREPARRFRIWVGSEPLASLMESSPLWTLSRYYRIASHGSLSRRLPNLPIIKGEFGLTPQSWQRTLYRLSN